MSYRLGILLTHPIQYYSPWFKYLDNKVDLEVFYVFKQSPKGQADAGFGVEFDWDINLLDGYKFTWLHNISKKPELGSFFGCNTPEIYKIIKDKKFDAFIVFGWNYKSAIQAIIACKRNKIPVFMRGDSHLLSKRSTLKKILKYLPYRILLPILNHLYVGKLNKQYLFYYGVPESRLFFVPHFVDNEYFETKSKKARENKANLEIRDNFNIPHDAFVLIFIGKFIDVKRPLDIVRATKKILKKGPKDIYVLFVGDGPLKDQLKVEAEDYINHFHFAGFKNQSEIPKYLTASDLLILPSYQETWGLVVNEAMACGIPVLISNVAGCAPDLVEDGKTGFIFEMGSINSLEKKILESYNEIKNGNSELKRYIADKMSIFSIKNATKKLMHAIDLIKKQDNN